MLRSLLAVVVLLLWVGCESPAVDEKAVASGRAAAATEQVSAGGAGARDFVAALDAYESGDYAAALKKVEAALASEQRPEYRQVRASMLLFSRRFDEAKAILVELRSQPKVAVGAQVGLGHLAINERQYERAGELLSVGLDLAPSSLSGGAGVAERYSDFVYELACLGMGWRAANRNEHVRAVSWFDRILTRQPDDLLGMIGRGNSLIGLNLLDDAARVLESVLESHPENPYAHAELAMIRLKKGQDQAAEQGFRSALAQDDRNYTCPYEGLGLLYLRQGRTERARENLERAIEINPDIEYKKYNGLARIHMSEGNYEAAEKLLRKSQENFPHDGEALQMLKELEALAASKGAN